MFNYERLIKLQRVDNMCMFDPFYRMKIDRQLKDYLFVSVKAP